VILNITPRILELSNLSNF